MTDNKTDSKDKYKDSVFLPKTDFPMRGELPKREPEILKKWQDMGLYAEMRKAAKTKKKWVLHDGPPYANGNIHMGHAVNKILKDVVVKSYAMLGYDSPYVPGWDCHGLPIEWKIEEKYREAGKDKDNVDPITFREECRAFAKHWVATQSAQFQRLGVTGAWDNPYLTMTNAAEATIAREIHAFAKNGGLYRGAKPVMWSVVEKTALAEAEVEYKDHKSITVWIRFPVKSTKLKALEGADIVIWTTTPWTLPSNRALAYGDNVEYSVYEVSEVEDGSKAKSGDKLALAVSLAEAVRTQAKIKSWKQHDVFKGDKVAETICRHPLHAQGYDFEVRSLSAGFVTEDAGTGFVHIAPGHGEDDFYLGTANNVEVTDNVADDGKFRDHVPLFAGLEVYTQKGELGAGNFAVLKAMEEAGALLAKGSIRHEYPHSWRSGAPLIFRTTPQWFIAMDNEIHLRETALKSISETRWVPAKGETRIRSMIENRPDWCISRQRAWGVPIALFVNKKTRETLTDENVFNRIFEIFTSEGSDAWWSRPASDFLGAQYNADDYEQIFDIVDVWFESGATHAFVLGDKKQWPEFEGVDQADLYLEGSDQHRGWFHSSLLESSGTRGRAPYKSVLTHGFVLDDKGYKMSKSLGNVVDPLETMQEHGADILRLWTMTSDYAEDIRIGKDTLKNTGDLYRRIRNTFRYLLGALDGFTKEEALFCHPERSEGSQQSKGDTSVAPLSQYDIKGLPELEQLVLHQLYEMDKKVRAYTQDFEFMKLTKELHEFCNNELSSFYFDIRKDRLYCDRPDSFERRATRTVMAHIFDALVTWFAPILAFTAEEAWTFRPQGVFDDAESVHLRTFPDVHVNCKNDALAKKWERIREIRSRVLGDLERRRTAGEIRSSLEAKATISVSVQEKEIFERVDMAEICIVSDVLMDFSRAEKEGSSTVTADKADGSKCDRCWKVLPEVGSHKEHPSLCTRCADTVTQGKKAAA